MFRYFETRIDPLAPSVGEPPEGLWAFYWHWVRQAKGLFAALFALGFALAVIEAVIPYLIGRLVSTLSSTPRERVLDVAGPTLAAMAVMVLVARPLGTMLFRLIVNHAIGVSFTSLVHWQSYWHVARQSLAFFQNDFAGRIANRVLQTARPLRESLLSIARSVWQIVIFGLASIGLMGVQDVRLALPMLLWFALYAGLLFVSVPRMQARSRETTEARSAVSGKVVDNITNMMTVKLFGHRGQEDAYIREAYTDFNTAFARQQRLSTLHALALVGLNAVFLVGTGGIAIWLFAGGLVDAGTLTTALLLTTQIISMSGWVAYEVMGIFENLGSVQEGMATIAQPLTMQDRPDARPLGPVRGEVRFEGVSFGYGGAEPVIDGLTLRIAPGEKVGLVGRSGAGKTTLVNLVLRFFEPEAGRVLIDGQDIAHCTQDSLRAHVAVVAQETSLLHRSIRDNILYGRPEAGEASMLDAARRSEAHAFVERLEDHKGRRGYEAHVGERGVKLSGGQRQRIAIARLFVKDAPIVILDEATAALDSEVEAAIQASLAGLMQGRTALAIAHRLSTLAIMDRIVVIDRGRIEEEGTHEALIARGGLYASLWARQSGGFLIQPEPARRQAAE